MKQLLYYMVVLCGLWLAFCACQRGTAGTAGDQAAQGNRYARGFSLQEQPYGYLLQTYNPWQPNAAPDSFALCRNGEACGLSVPLIRIPIHHTAITSCTFAGYLGCLNQTDAITAICNASSIYQAQLRQRIQAGNYIDAGDAFSLSYEQLSASQPDLILANNYGIPDPVLTRLSEQIPVLLTTEWIEPHILGRAEWIRVYGALTDLLPQSDSLFNVVCRHYTQLSVQASQCKTKPSVLTGFPYQGTWYLPGGKSFLCQLIHDAGGCYAIEDNQDFQSQPYDLETVLSLFGESRYWIGAEQHSLDKIIAIDPRFAHFTAFKHQQVYNYQKRSTPEGGNDFWESALVRPDLLLSDLITILHPEISPSHTLWFFQSLSNPHP